MDELVQNNARGTAVNWQEVANTMYLSSTFSEQEVCFIVASMSLRIGGKGTRIMLIIRKRMCSCALRHLHL